MLLHNHVHVQQAALCLRDLTVDFRVRANARDRFNWLNQYFILSNTYCSYFPVIFKTSALFASNCQ